MIAILLVLLLLYRHVLMRAQELEARWFGFFFRGHGYWIPFPHFFFPIPKLFLLENVNFLGAFPHFLF